MLYGIAQSTPKRRHPTSRAECRRQWAAYDHDFIKICRVVSSRHEHAQCLVVLRNKLHVIC